MAYSASYPRTSGVYRITHEPSGRIYVGSSWFIERRWKTHRNKLRTGIHENGDMQEVADATGAESFSLDILEVCSRDRLHEREQYWMDRLRVTDPAVGFNCDVRADTSAGRRVSQRAKRRVRAALIGRKQSAATRAKIARAMKGKRNAVGVRSNTSLTERDVREILTRAADGADRAHLAAEYGISPTAVGRIVSRTTWWHVEIPEEVSAKLVSYRERIRRDRRAGRRLTAQKLTVEQVREIRSRKASGETNAAIAADYGITNAMVSSIYYRRTWKHVD